LKIDTLKLVSFAENYLRNLIYFPLWVNSYSHYCCSLWTTRRSFKQIVIYLQSINTRHKHDLHMPNANLTSYQKGIYYAGIKLFSTLPSSITSLSHDVKVFKPALRDYLLSHSSYSVEEFTLI
jgi:hypothetical protein